MLIDYLDCLIFNQNIKKYCNANVLFFIFNGCNILKTLNKEQDYFIYIFY